MSRGEDVQELIGEIKKNLQVFTDLEVFLARAQDNELKLLGRTQSAALIVAGILENSYTCLETMFMRIAGTREAVLSDKADGILAELLRFRHFKRSYFEIEYDWDRLDFLMKKLDQLAPIIRQDIAAFMSFLERISNLPDFPRGSCHAAPENSIIREDFGGLAQLVERQVRNL